MLLLLPQRYIFSSKSQLLPKLFIIFFVVVATTKVHIFKQITTALVSGQYVSTLLLLPQRYIFSSKSQLRAWISLRVRGCCCYHKGTYFQANHNSWFTIWIDWLVVVATTKVHIFKQITTKNQDDSYNISCCCYHKGTYFQANHNTSTLHPKML